MRSADDFVTASLAGLMKNEVVRVPALADTALLDRIAEAQVALLRASHLQPALAERYRPPTHKG
jgi:hypothetical protein